jgi:E3 ubiquitin-protein ligase UBR4
MLSFHRLTFCGCGAGLSDDDDYCLELLVAGQIISLSLPIRQVFEEVWLPSLRASGTAGAGDPLVISGPRGEWESIGPPMVITYRLPVRLPVTYYHFFLFFHP